MGAPPARPRHGADDRPRRPAVRAYPGAAAGRHRRGQRARHAQPGGRQPRGLRRRVLGVARGAGRTPDGRGNAMATERRLVRRRPAGAEGDPDPGGRSSARLDRGRNAMLRDASKRRLCMRFTRGDSYLYLDERGRDAVAPDRHLPSAAAASPRTARARSTTSSGRSSRTRSRRPRSASPTTRSTRPPPTPRTPARRRCREKVSTYGYDQWRVRKAVDRHRQDRHRRRRRRLRAALLRGQRRAVQLRRRPWVGQGDVRIKTFDGNEVYWEPGCDFDDCRRGGPPSRRSRSTKSRRRPATSAGR